MSEENVERMRRALAAFNRGDLDAVLADASPDFEYLASGALPDFQGEFRGIDEYKRLMSWVPDVFDDPLAEATGFLDAGDHVVIALTFSGRGKQSGAGASWKLWQVYTFREGKFVRGQGFTSRDEALEAAGLSE